MLNRITDALDFQAQALTLRSERQRLIASNIANADTPGYQARDMDFAAALRQATSGGAGAMPASAGLATTQGGHLSAAGGARATAQLLYASPGRPGSRSWCPPRR